CRARLTDSPRARTSRVATCSCATASVGAGTAHSRSRATALHCRSCANRIDTAKAAPWWPSTRFARRCAKAVTSSSSSSADSFMSAETLDDFRDVSGWTAVASGQAQLLLAHDTGPIGGALRLDYDFKGGGGFVVARKPFGRRMPESWAIELQIRGAA